LYIFRELCYKVDMSLKEFLAYKVKTNPDAQVLKDSRDTYTRADAEHAALREEVRRRMSEKQQSSAFDPKTTQKTGGMTGYPAGQTGGKSDHA